MPSRDQDAPCHHWSTPSFVIQWGHCALWLSPVARALSQAGALRPLHIAPKGTPGAGA